MRDSAIHQSTKLVKAIRLQFVLNGLYYDPWFEFTPLTIKKQKRIEKNKEKLDFSGFVNCELYGVLATAAESYSSID